MSTESNEAAASRDALIHVRPVDLVVSALLFVLGVVLAVDNWRIGVSWASEGPQSGYFPFRLSLILVAASAWGFITTLRSGSGASESFVDKSSFVRVLQVLVPTIAFVAGIGTIGIYVSSALLIALFMIWMGRSNVLTSIATASVFSLVIFWMFEIQFKVLLPKGPVEAWLGF